MGFNSVFKGLIIKFHACFRLDIKEIGLILHFNVSIMKTISLMAVEFQKALILLVTGIGVLQYFSASRMFMFLLPLESFRLPTL